MTDQPMAFTPVSACNGSADLDCLYLVRAALMRFETEEM